ncbi:MAG: hypothetical protein J07AB43_02150 [Candidatus Nanosalina sp. J07AB43]|jgi:hypothetical protein|nr:MAG: hypothetical protein J07AB43_02150 [Candidatus Nanosalina sp. J07AB43]
MGLEEFQQSEQEEEETTIKTRKQLGNVTVDEAFWTGMIARSPDWAMEAALCADGNGDKAIIQRANEILDTDEHNVDLDPDEEKRLRENVEEFIQDYLEE